MFLIQCNKIVYWFSIPGCFFEPSSLFHEKTVATKLGCGRVYSADGSER